MPKGFASDTAKKTGKTTRSVQQAISRAENIPSKVMDAIKGA